MSVVIRLARAGTKKRPVYHVVVADSRFPRDGRFIERLGHFNPLLPKDNAERLKLDMDKVKAWLAKGAQPSDRVTRFLDAAGVVKRAARNNPEKAVPRKERKAQAEAAAKTGVSRSSGATTVAAPICVARIGAAHGVRGAVKLWTFTEDPFAVKRYGPLDDQGRRAPVRSDERARGQGPSGRDAEGRRDPRGRRAPQRHRTLCRARKTAGDRRGRILPRRPDRACRGERRRRAARPRRRDPQFRRRRHHRDRAAAAAPTMLLPFTNAVVPTVDIAGGRVVIELPAEIEGDEPIQRGRLSMAAEIETPEARPWRATVSLCFRRCSRGRSASALPARRWRRASGRWRRAISGTRPPTATAASTIPRPAAGPAWCCAPTCWRPRSMPPMSRPDRPRLLMSPRGRPLTQSAGRGTRRRARAR